MDLFKIDDRVQIQTGVFAGVEGTVIGSCLTANKKSKNIIIKLDKVFVSAEHSGDLSKDKIEVNPGRCVKINTASANIDQNKDQ